MTNLLNIARNEFANLANSKLIWLVGAIYAFFAIHEMVNLFPPGDPHYVQTLAIVNAMNPASEPAYYTFVLLITLSHILMFYGGFFGLMLGVFTVGLERYGNTLNTLVVKPLYRDTIINGKLLGSLLFILAVFTFTIIVYTLFAMVTWGDSFMSLAVGYLVRLPLIALLALIVVLVYFAMSMLISMLVRDMAFALILSLCSSVLLDYLPTTLIQGSLTIILGLGKDALQFQQWVPPANIVYGIYKNPASADSILYPTMDFYQALADALPDIAKLIVYLTILVFASYTVFVRSDIS